MLSKTTYGFQYLKFQKEKNSTEYISFRIFLQNEKAFIIDSSNPQKNLQNSLFVQQKLTWSYDQTKFVYSINITYLKPYIMNNTLFITLGVNENTQPKINSTEELPGVEESELILFNIDTIYKGDELLKEYIHNIEFYHPAFLGAKLVFYFIIIILCIVFSKQQPLKSRGYVPLISAGFFFLYHASQAYRFFVPLRIYQEI